MSDEVLWGRRCRLTIALPTDLEGDFDGVKPNAIEINGADDPTAPGMRVQFKITASTQKEPNTSEITVTNLAPDHRAALQQKGVKVQLEAGYEATGMAVYFRGDARTVDHLRDKADWNTKIKCGDGDRAFRYAQASESFAADTSAADVLKYLAGQLGLQLGNVPAKVADFSVRFGSGYVVEGSVQRSLDRLVKSLGFTWSIQEGGLQVLAPGEAVASAVPLITSFTGLVGSPEMGSPEKKGKPQLLKFKCMLTPVRPGGLVALRSERYDGQVRVNKVEHSGDIRGQEWYTTIEGVLHGGG